MLGSVTGMRRGGDLYALLEFILLESLRWDCLSLRVFLMEYFWISVGCAQEFGAGLQVILKSTRSRVRSPGYLKI